MFEVVKSLKKRVSTHISTLMSQSCSAVRFLGIPKPGLCIRQSTSSLALGQFISEIYF
jgi:hypothetical protein